MRDGAARLERYEKYCSHMETTNSQGIRVGRGSLRKFNEWSNQVLTHKRPRLWEVPPLHHIDKPRVSVQFLGERMPEMNHSLFFP